MSRKSQLGKYGGGEIRVIPRRENRTNKNPELGNRLDMLRE